MDKAIIMENITRQTELIVEQNNNIKTYIGKIPQIDMDIIKSNIRKLYEQYCNLEKTNLILSTDNLKERKEEVPFVIEEFKETEEKPLIIVHEKPVIEEKTIIAETPQSLVVDEHIEVIFTPEPKAVIEEKALEIREEQIPIEKPKTETPIDLFGSTLTIADKYKDDTKSLNERIQKNKTDKSYSSRMQHNAIKDLKSAIGINEKFLFINELFKGNMKEYNETILKLNEFKTLAEAVNLLEEFQKKYKWADDMVAYLTLKDFVERKHI
ncbi:MAG: hypothetical protein HXX18_12725 [Bacteroidetes bacterium]|nr:hypothetical protein [Bacteroidota bacterium]